MEESGPTAIGVLDEKDESQKFFLFCTEYISVSKTDVYFCKGSLWFAKDVSLRVNSPLGEVTMLRLVSRFTSLDSPALLHTNNKIISPLVKSGLVKLETSHSVSLSPHWVAVNYANLGSTKIAFENILVSNFVFMYLLRTSWKFNQSWFFNFASK